MANLKVYIIWCCIVFTGVLNTQNTRVNWLSFPQLETALQQQPKKTIIHFYANWCNYCHKMEQAVYSKPNIAQRLNTQFYAVKFNVERTDSITFGGKTFVNTNSGKRRLAYHQIPEFLAGQKDKPMQLPAIVILNEDFTILKRYFKYIPPKEFQHILEQL